MNTNNEFYAINTADIWHYENSLFLTGKTDIDFAQRLLSNLESIISQKGQALFALKAYDNGIEPDKSYFKKKIQSILDCENNLRTKYEVGNFISIDDEVFTYADSVEVTKADKSYDYWFALKLRQYENDLKGITNFLSYQSKSNFEKNHNGYLEFLNTTIHQFNDVLSEKVSITTKKWIEKATKRQKQIKKNVAVHTLNKNNTKTKKGLINLALKSDVSSNMDTSKIGLEALSSEIQLLAMEDSIEATVEDFLFPFKEKIKEPNYSNLCSALCIFFRNGKFPSECIPIKVGNINKKEFGWALRSLFKTEKSDTPNLTLEYLSYAKDNISLFNNVKFDRTDKWRQTTLYKYFTTKPLDKYIRLK